jgi:hypothetical protein
VRGGRRAAIRLASWTDHAGRDPDDRGRAEDHQVVSPLTVALDAAGSKLRTGRSSPFLTDILGISVDVGAAFPRSGTPTRVLTAQLKLTIC